MTLVKKRIFNECKLSSCRKLAKPDFLFCSEDCSKRYFESRTKITKKTKKKHRNKTKRKKANKVNGPDLGFYYSTDWRRIRYMAIVKYGRVCMACGENGRKIHVDHIKPRSKYPELELCLTNLQILCEDCNIGKGAWDETDWRKEGV